MLISCQLLIKIRIKWKNSEYFRKITQTSIYSRLTIIIVYIKEKKANFFEKLTCKVKKNISIVSIYESI